MPCGFIHFIANGRIPLFFMAEIIFHHMYVYICAVYMYMHVYYMYTVHDCFLLSAFMLVFVIFCLFDNNHLNRCQVIRLLVVIRIVLISHTEHLFMYLLVSACLLWQHVLSYFCAYF